MTQLIGQFGESRINNRGPLIAVIKIEIDSNNVDRIFLHQNDNDYRLAEQFTQKHNLNVKLVQHIYERIKISRLSIQNSQIKHQNNINNGQQEMSMKKKESGSFTQIKSSENSQFINSKRNMQQYESQSFNELKNQLNNVIKDTKNIPSLFNSLENQKNQQKIKRFHQIQEKDELNIKPARHVQSQYYFAQQNSLTQNKINYAQVTPLKDKNLNNKVIEPDKKSRIGKIYINSAKKSNNQAPVQLKKHQTSKSVNQFFNNLERSYQKNDKNDTIKKQSHNDSIKIKYFKKQDLEKLHQSMKRTMSKQQISRINKNVTSRLYNEAEIKKNYLNLIRQKAKKQKQKEEQAEEFTYRPAINSISKAIAEGRRKQVPLEEYLIQEGKKIQIKRQQQASKKLQKQLEHCSFHPQISSISQKLTTDRSRALSTGPNHQCKKDHCNHEHDHKPSISKNSIQIMKNRGGFQQRQKQYQESKNIRLLQKIREKRIQEQKDQQSGQDLFKPKINDLGVRQSCGAKIGDYLYSFSQQPKKNNNLNNFNVKINQSSQNIVHQMQFKRIAWLFSQLDSDQDGVISPHKICIQNISSQILNIIKPILFEMQELNQELSLLEFKNAVFQLHKKLNAFDKSILYNYKQKQK